MNGVPAQRAAVGVWVAEANGGDDGGAHPIGLLGDDDNTFGVGLLLPMMKSPSECFTEPIEAAESVVSDDAKGTATRVFEDAHGGDFMGGADPGGS